MSDRAGEVIDEYLDALCARLRTTPRETRRILAEAEDHLREGAAAGIEAGMSEREAAEAAISSFGSVRSVVRAHTMARWRSDGTALAADFGMGAWKLASVCLLAIGGSGALAWLMNSVLGRQFVGGTGSAASFPPATCQYWLSIHPAARNCGQAAMLEISADAVSLRLAAGVAGLLLFAAWYLARRWATGVLPEAFLPTVAVSLFGVAAAGLTWLSARGSLGAAVPLAAGPGPGFYLSGAIAAAVMAVLYLMPLQRALLRRAHGR